MKGTSMKEIEPNSIQSSRQREWLIGSTRPACLGAAHYVRDAADEIASNQPQDLNDRRASQQQPKITDNRRKVQKHGSGYVRSGHQGLACWKAWVVVQRPATTNRSQLLFRSATSWQSSTFQTRFHSYLYNDIVPSCRTQSQCGLSGLMRQTYS